MLVETKNRTLEETAALFDNKDLAREVAEVIESPTDEKDQNSTVFEKASETAIEEVAIA